MMTTWIIVLHVAILAFQLIGRRLFPHQKRAVGATYFVLMPIGFTLFTKTDAWLTCSIVAVALVYILYAAERSVVAAGKAQA
jgi:hypothetical protein